jgi:hypothetical protein
MKEQWKLTCGHPSHIPCSVLKRVVNIPEIIFIICKKIHSQYCYYRKYTREERWERKKKKISTEERKKSEMLFHNNNKQ